MVCVLVRGADELRNEIDMVLLIIKKSTKRLLVSCGMDGDWNI